ncbi:MAG: sulfotransferase domain-containing protein [Pirellulales bacterium]|nr:sulfotransferase domain-containing protein [Pirellulales bacterium]
MFAAAFLFALPMVARTALVALAAVLVFLVVQYLHLYLVVAWGEKRTAGNGYFGRPLAERKRFKRLLRCHRLVLSPILWPLSRLSRFRFSTASFSYRGVPGPRGTCSPESFRLAVEYEPRSDDVFVATQMKCGTTWMQHVVYQVLMRGAGDLAETGTALYAVSPWIESLKSVSVNEAPRVGIQRPSRIIKTHLPVSLCPYRAEAKYIYVCRHPVSCFASCADFIRTNAGAFAAALDEIERWFCSEASMWWGTWPSHVRGWWSWSRGRENVLFVSFEEMKRDLRRVVQRVAEFLAVQPLEAAEIDAIVGKCSFEYMRKHADLFEMNPPHVLQTPSSLLVSGKLDRHKDVPDAFRQRLLTWCRSEMHGSDFPLEVYYPDIAAAAAPGVLQRDEPHGNAH